MLFAMEVNNPLDQAITALVMAAYQFIMAVAWLLTATVNSIAYSAKENVAIIGKLTAIIAITIVLATNPSLTAGIAITIAFAYITRRK